MQGADFRGAVLRGAASPNANLQGADLSKANMRLAILIGADLQGADVSETALQDADLRYANLEGANLRYADVQGANFRGAFLQGARLIGANLRRADLTDADLQGVDLRGADVWMTQPPRRESFPQFVDLESIKLEPPNTKADREAWKASKAYRVWADLKAMPVPDRAKLTSFLASLACSDVAKKPYMAQGLVFRAFVSNFNGDLLAFYEAITRCGVVERIPESYRQALEIAVRYARQSPNAEGNVTPKTDSQPSR